MEDTTIAKIAYEYDPDAILGDLPEDEYDFDETKHRFKELCHAELKQAFPETAIEISESYGSRFTVNGGTDHVAIPKIEDLCLKVWITQDYLVRRADNDIDPHTFYPINHEDFTLSPGLIRWSCKHNLIEGANRNGWLWTLTTASFFKFHRIFIKGDLGSAIWLIKSVSDKVSSITGVDDAKFFKSSVSEAFQDGVTILISSDVVTLPVPLSSANSYLLLVGDAQRKQVKVEFFDDVVAWEHSEGVAFSKFSNTFYETSRLMNYKVEKCPEHVGRQQPRHSIEISFPISSGMEVSVGDCVSKIAGQIKHIVENTEIKLKDGLPWHTKYEQGEKAEAAFRDEYLKKLLELLKYDVVKLEHGPFEFGKDIIFAETTKFGVRRYFALQAKKGDLSGDAKNDMDVIMSQLEDAFAVPFRESQTLEHKFISGFVIAISGKFKNNAQEKIWARLLRQGRVGMVYFWDRDVVQDLMRFASLSRRLSQDTQKNMMPNYLKEV